MGNNTYHPQNGIYLPTSHEVSNISIRNNIITGFLNAPVLASEKTTIGSINNLSIENNLFYENGYRNAPKFEKIKLMNMACSKNKKGKNPMFVSEADFHLKARSPAIGAGIKVGIEKDYDDKPFSDPPSIGAYEYTLD